MSRIEREQREKRLKELRVFVSVSNKEGIVDFINQTKELFPTEVIATGGTGRHLTEAGIEVTSVEKLTNFPTVLSGRVKSLHPVIFAAILADQQNPEHMKDLQLLGIEPFNMVVVNFYPFQETVQRRASLKEVIEQIDIGGPAAVRAAAKNFQSIIVVCNPKDYSQIAEALKEQGNLSFDQRKELAENAFELTSQYDQTIKGYLSSLSNGS